MKGVIKSEFMRFLAVGGFAAGVNFVSRIFLNEYMSFRWAVFMAYLIGMLTAYLFSRWFVFEPSGKHPGNELFRFALVNLAAVAQVWLISVGLAEYLFPAIGFTFFYHEVAHLIGLAIPAITSYYGHKYFSFGKVRSEG